MLGIICGCLVIDQPYYKKLRSLSWVSESIALTVVLISLTSITPPSLLSAVQNAKDAMTGNGFEANVELSINVISKIARMSS